MCLKIKVLPGFCKLFDILCNFGNLLGYWSQMQLIYVFGSILSKYHFPHNNIEQINHVTEFIHCEIVAINFN